jgi:hypothetical protein
VVLEKAWQLITSGTNSFTGRSIAASNIIFRTNDEDHGKINRYKVSSIIDEKGFKL